MRDLNTRCLKGMSMIKKRRQERINTLKLLKLFPD